MRRLEWLFLLMLTLVPRGVGQKGPRGRDPNERGLRAGPISSQEWKLWRGGAFSVKKWAWTVVTPALTEPLSWVRPHSKCFPLDQFIESSHVPMKFISIFQMRKHT